jgi:hypothetical protein
MPAPFDVDWPPLRNVIEAMTQRLNDVSRRGAYRRLIGEWQRGALKARKGLGSNRSCIIDEGEPVDLIALSGGTDAQGDKEYGASETNGGEAIVLCGEDVIALWPRLVLSCDFPRLGTSAPKPSPAASNEALQAGGRSPPMKTSDSPASITVPHRDLVAFYRDRFGPPGAATNREDMDREAEQNFGRRIAIKALAVARREAGVKGKVGRPKKSSK